MQETTNIKEATEAKSFIFGFGINYHTEWHVADIDPSGTGSSF